MVVGNRQANRRPVFCIAGAESSPSVANCAPLWKLAERKGWYARQIAFCTADEVDDSVALLVLTEGNADKARRQFPHALVAGIPGTDGADLLVPDNAAEPALRQLLRHSETHWRRNLKVMELFREVGLRRQRMSQLSEIGLSLSTRTDFAELQETILREVSIMEKPRKEAASDQGRDGSTSGGESEDSF